MLYYLQGSSHSRRGGTGYMVVMRPNSLLVSTMGKNTTMVVTAMMSPTATYAGFWYSNLSTSVSVASVTMTCTSTVLDMDSADPLLCDSCSILLLTPVENKKVKKCTCSQL
eukprot:GHVT01062782.1.p1 GENE.GHVT01062782.1~~GHVT01062782.1.p1  ORF type:complete len:111 (+),score=3.10 GHVT01062782.1:228-560(+)